VIVAHVGPPLARTGGPAGYLLQLRDALAGARPAHRILLPDAAGAQGTATAAPAPIARRVARRVWRAITGAPKFYRPAPASLQRRGGELDSLVRRSLAQMTADAEPSLQRGIAERAAVLFAHDVAGAAAALERRRPGQQVWLMLHSPMSIALYLSWTWGVPEQDYGTVLSYPDVRFWTAYEAGICARVDRVVLPCREAASELERCDPAFAAPLARAEILPTGASRGATPVNPKRHALRAKFGLPVDQPVGVFLGSLQPYRGFDALAAGLDRLPDLVALPGTIAVAGPDPLTVPVHDRVRAVGRVDDVASLLLAADFVVNVNRFSLFDLSIVESLEAGRPVLLHDAGGHRAFAALGAGLIRAETLEPAVVAGALERAFSMPRADLDRLGRQSRACYDAHLTPAAFAARHLALYERAATARRAALSA
jgi:glycosyltransferase involved in cell wall biosynthesis